MRIFLLRDILMESNVSAFSVDKLMEETRRIAREYKKSTGQALPISHELGRYDAEKILNLTTPSSEEPGVDFVGSGELLGYKISVKSRVLFQPSKSGQRMGALNIEGAWEYLLLIIYNSNYEPEEIYSAPKQIIINELQSSKPNKRGSFSIAKFKLLSELIWVQENVA